MIRRDNDYDFFLISQIAHARLALHLAAAVGNPRFTPPLPRTPVLKAIELHDEGWPLHDDAPTIDHAARPTDAFEMPLESSLRIWSDSTNRAAAAEPYAGLLVALHGLALAGRVKPGPDRPRAETFALIRFQHAQVEIQESLRRRLGLRLDLPLHNGLPDPAASAEDDLLLCNFHLLEFADQLSLNLCFDECRFATIELSPRPAQSLSHIRFESKGSGVFSAEPWPFNGKSLRLTIAGRHIPRRRYESDEDLRRQYAAASEQIHEICLMPR